MLRQHQLIRMQVHQLMDACLFALGFWLAFELRAVPAVIEFLKLQAAPPDDTYFWIFLFLIPSAPMILEWQGFYNRPAISPRWMMLWPLLRLIFSRTPDFSTSSSSMVSREVKRSISSLSSFKFISSKAWSIAKSASIRTEDVPNARLDSTQIPRSGPLESGEGE